MPVSEIIIDAGTGPLTDWLRHRDIPLNTRCGERGLCDSCLVEIDSRQVRACQVTVEEHAGRRVRIPERSVIAQQPRVASGLRINIPRAHDPLAPAGLGVAVDIGTTTVDVLLVDLKTGRITGRASGFNGQLKFGDDVLTRIQRCPELLPQLQQAIIATMAALLGGARPVCMTVAGNTTMLHLLSGTDPTPIAVAPFAPAFLEHRVLKLPGLSDVVHLLPGMSAYVGADMCAGLLASGLAYDAGPSLLLDVGTNGEMILRHAGRLYGCATAAGPAFEGVGLSCGMRAAPGAIERIRLRPERHLRVIGQRGAIGVCGSGYIDVLAECRRTGMLSERGHFAAREPLVLTDKVHVTEADIARLLQAKAAIAAGILTLLERVGLQQRQIKRLYLAGGFGRHLNIRNSIDCGILPGFSPGQVQVVGNSSLAGAYLALVDAGALGALVGLSRQLEVVELNLDPDYESRFIGQLGLPQLSASHQTQ